MNDYFYFMIEGYPKPFGYVHRNVVTEIPWIDAWSLDHERRLLTFRHLTTFDERTAAMQATLRDALETRTSLVLEPWADELFLLYAADGEHVLDMDGCGQDLFGMRVQGVHVTVWTETDQGRMYWVQRRRHAQYCKRWRPAIARTSDRWHGERIGGKGLSSAAVFPKAHSTVRYLKLHTHRVQHGISCPPTAYAICV